MKGKNKMIYADGKQFLLEGKKYCYAMFINSDGFLQQLHYGGKIKREDLGYLAETYPSVVPNHSINKDEAFDYWSSEYGFYAKGDYKDPTGIFERKDGASMSRLRYKGYCVEKGVPELKGLPHVRKGDETLVITLKDDFSDIEVDLYYTVCENSNVLTRNAVIRNVGKEPIMLKRAFSFRAELANGEYKLLRLAGRWGQERIPEIAPVAHGVTRLHSLRGSSSHQTNPFMGILKEGCGEEQGECYGVQLVYSGSFALTAEWSKYGALTLQGGINETGFCWELCGGESFVTPQALLTYSNTGMGGMSREIHDFLRERIVNPAYAFKHRPVVINNWEATYFNFDNEKLCHIIDEAAKLGIDTFVLDDGWFGGRVDSDFAGLGDWVVNEEKLKGGLKTVSECCKKHGMKFGLWFEPEMVNEDSDLFRAHPDWALCKAGVEPMRSRQQLVLDFTRKEVVDYIFGAVGKVIRENDISYIKWDMNRYVSECYSASLPARRQGEVMHRYILGVYDLAQRLLNEFPDLFIEGCAGGGGRFDAGMLYYFPQIWTSDDSDGYERTKIQWGTSLCYPLSSMSCHVSVCPNHQTGRTVPFDTRGRIASLGAFGYELDVTKMTEVEKEGVKAQIEAYKRIDDLVLSGDLYRLSNALESNYFCVLVVRKDKGEAYVVGERGLCIPYWSDKYYPRIRLYGLDDNADYEIEELGAVLSGGALQRVGLSLPKTGDFGSWVWHLKKIK